VIRWSRRLLHVLVAALTLAVLDRDNDERLARLERKIDFIGEQIILAVAIVVGCVVGYIVQEEIGKGWPVLIGAGLTTGGVFLVLHSRFRRHTS
jgi:hypothetical protein